MPNCLITTLKGTVNNSDLIKIGEIRLFCEQSDTANTLTNGVKIGIDAGCSVTVESVNGDACIAEVLSETNTTLPSEFSASLTLRNTSTSGIMYKTFVFKNTDCEVRVHEKYVINHIRIFNSSESVVKNWGFKDISHIINSNIEDGYTHGVKLQGMLQFKSKAETPLTTLRLGFINKGQETGGIDIDVLPINLSILALARTDSIGDVKNYFTTDRDTITVFNVPYTNVTGDVSHIAKWLSAKSVYTKNIQCSSLMTIGNLSATSEEYTIFSEDSGASYKVKKAASSVILGTYTIATDTWSY